MRTIVVRLTIDADPEAWDAEYGTGTSFTEVSQDVRRYIETTVAEQLRLTGAARVL